jgi:hypothetical protein
VPVPVTKWSDETSPALAVFFRDVTDRHEAEVARERMTFLAEVSAILSSSLDYQATLDSMANLVVPGLCDWCAIQMPSADNTLLQQVRLPMPIRQRCSGRVS